MISFKECANLDSIQDMKEASLQNLTAPLDGMWEVGFINAAPHWLVLDREEIVGYHVVNDDGALLQFYLRPGWSHFSSDIFATVIERESIKSAIVQTIDPFFLSHCMDHQKSVSVHSLLYKYDGLNQSISAAASSTTFQCAKLDELERIVAFQIECLGGNTALKDWLDGYSTNLISREELFVLRQGTKWIGLGEYRNSDSQPGVVDVGVMVDPAYRGNGWASHILSELAQRGIDNRHDLICSTTVDNIASQKAAVNAGFVSNHRILHVAFSTGAA